MVLPNFLIIGAQKAGTSWLGTNLGEHPDIFLHTKELHFFDKKTNLMKGLKWYEKQFTEVKKEKAIGEKTPEYILLSCLDTGKNAETIYQFFPDVKLIVSLRNPVTRALSQLNHLIVQGNIYVKDSADLERITFNYDMNIIRRGYYYRQLIEYFKLFRKEQIMVIFYEDDICLNPEKTLEKICLFLNVSCDYQFQGIKRKINDNKHSDFYVKNLVRFPFFRSKIFSWIDRNIQLTDRYKMPISNELVDKLYEAYREENLRLFDFLGRKITTWQKEENSKK